MKTVLKVFLTVTFPLWIVPAMVLGVVILSYATISDLVDDLSS